MNEPKNPTKTELEKENTYVYRHAGIKERAGRIPFWLLLVAVGLIVWSVYYTIKYWSES
ncbi:hypothetical protein [uncultured Nitrospira sp.]|uniref:hypothetical protein n=1 Tax=uncultured Nitrospira sp. TaxID=157176 RepID=UPI003140A0A2